MKWLNYEKIRLMFVVFMAAVVLGSETAKADFTFGTPTNLGSTVNTGSEEINPEISADGLELLFSGERNDGYGQSDLWVSTRATINDDWGAPVNIGPPINSSYDESGPSISADGLQLYFEADQPGGCGERDLWVSTRPTRLDHWGKPMNLGEIVNTTWRDGDPAVSSDGLSLFFESLRPHGYGERDLWVSTRPTLSDPWRTPVNLGAIVNTAYYDGDPEISADGLMLFFNSNRPGGSGGFDIWVTRRATIDDDWGVPVNLGSIVNSPIGEGAPSLSADGRTLFYASNPSEWFLSLDSDIWQASINPIVDLNGDAIVDIHDLVIMIENWDTSESPCDIGPSLLGDGVVDFRDLAVLTEYWLEDYRLIAHWKLDETEGAIAYDSIGSNDGTLNGDPNWHPAAGRIDGALEFNGINDCVNVPLVLDTPARPFSVFVWVKGGMPGQAVFSQASRSDWLLADTTDGSLMTDLTFFGKASRPLLSQAIITDGDWHHVGLVWDEPNRTLYVDGEQVASDTYETGPLHLFGDLQIGAGKDLDPASFWLGLIDDVRVYNQALTAEEIEELAR